MCTRASAVRMRSSCSTPVEAGVDQRLGERALDGEARIEGVERVLEDELRLPAEGAQTRPGESAERLALEGDAPGASARRA